MSKTKVVLNSAGIRELLRSEEMQKLLGERAGAVVERCGSGYESDIHVGKNRANAMITAKTAAAKADNLKNDTILRSLR